MHEQVARRFSEAASNYEQAARIQAEAATRFDAWLAQLGLGAPACIAEIGCGTGFLTSLLHARYPDARLHATDFAPAMVERCRASLPSSDKLSFAVCDGRNVRFEPATDWIVSTMCFQWFDPLLPVLQWHLARCRVLAFSVMLDGSFAEWRAAHERAGLAPGLQAWPDYDALLRGCDALSGGRMHAQRISLTEQHADGLSFVRRLRAIGADQPHPGHRPANLRPVLRQLEQGTTANYEIGFFGLEN